MPPCTRNTDKARTDLQAVQVATAELEAENSLARQQLADATERRREEEGAVEAARQRAAALAREKAELSSTAVAAQRQASYTCSSSGGRGRVAPWKLGCVCPLYVLPYTSRALRLHSGRRRPGRRRLRLLGHPGRQRCSLFVGPVSLSRAPDSCSLATCAASCGCFVDS